MTRSMESAWVARLGAVLSGACLGYVLIHASTGATVSAQLIAYPQCVQGSDPCPDCEDTDGESQCYLNLQGWLIGGCTLNHFSTNPCRTLETTCGQMLDCSPEPQVIEVCPTGVDLCTNQP